MKRKGWSSQHPYNLTQKGQIGCLPLRSQREREEGSKRVTEGLERRNSQKSAAAYHGHVANVSGGRREDQGFVLIIPHTIKTSTKRGNGSGDAQT